MGYIRVLLLLGFVVKFWWLILAVLVVLVVSAAAWVGRMHLSYAVERTRREHAALVARANQQHAWILAGDDRGVYGEYTPKQID
jgi:hypothetical protein